MHLAAVVKVERWDETRLRVPAAFLTLVIMAGLSMVLLEAPVPRLVRAADDAVPRMRLDFIARPRAPAGPAPAPAVQAQAKPHATAAPAAAPRHAQPAPVPVPPLPAPHQRAPATQPQPIATPEAPTPQDSTIARALYNRDGQARLPPGVVPDAGAEPEGSPPGMANARDAAKAKRVLERPNPIDYKETRFEKDWVSKGTLGDVAAQKMNRAISDFFKSDRTQATARPPPDTHFNPALAQNQADLGSEATGDAYKAAPIAFEKAPQPTGTATRLIQAQLAELEKRATSCQDPRRDKWLGDVRSNLQDLQRNETALTHGADQMRAKYLIPQAIDAAYDLSRRALWYADKQLKACAK